MSSDLRALRFLMAGSVDDGKSTLTGRLLYECQAILADQLGRLQDKSAGETLDLALLTDGLEAEREQGITIDVAYRYFSTRKRKFIIADAPGHEQYTRNMVTAAAGSDLAVILVDITKLDLSASSIALLAQTRRHAILASLLRVPRIVFAVNKIDAVDQPRSAFEAVSSALRKFADEAKMSVDAIIPISALRGDNVTSKGALDWYEGPTLLELLEAMPVDEPGVRETFSMPVQYVARDTALTSNPVRIIWGRLASGSVRAGDQVQLFPSNERACVTQVHRAGEVAGEVHEGQSAGLVLDRHIDVTRGNWLASPRTVRSAERFHATIAWLDSEPAQLRRKYLLRHGSRWVQGRIDRIESCLDIHTLERTSGHELAANDIASVIIETQDALPLDLYSRNRTAGSLIIVDPSTHRTSGALMVTAVVWDERSDVRVHPRAELAFPVTLSLPDNARLARAENLSCGGLMVTSGSVLGVGSRIEVEFTPPGCARVRTNVRVVDHRSAGIDQYQYHLAFISLDRESHEAIESCVAAVSTS